jgi:hypothetical protein
MDSVIQFRGTIYENGYGLIASKVMRDKSIPKQSRLIYAYMCSFASIDKDGNRVAFPSVSLQCEELDMSEDTYYKWRKVLEQRGLITIEKRKENGKFERNLYFIEAVPVPKDTSSEPYPKNSGTEDSGTEKQGAIINSSNSISFNKNSNNKEIANNDDDKRTSSAEHDDAQIELLISNFREATKDDLSERSFKSVVRKVVDKYNQGKVNSFRDYLVSSLIRKIDELELRRQKDNAKQQIATGKKQRIQSDLKQLEIRDVPFYNWLDEGANRNDERISEKV